MDEGKGYSIVAKMQWADANSVPYEGSRSLNTPEGL
jgi:hypothetical protein